MPDFMSTVRTLKKAIEESPKNVDLRMHLAKVYDENDCFREACDEYVKITSIDKNNQEAIFGLGSALYRLKDLEAAKKQLRNCLLPKAKVLFAKILGEEKDPAAEKYYKEAIDEDPDLTDDWLEKELFGVKVVDRTPPKPHVEKSNLSFKDVAGLQDLKKVISRKIIEPFKQNHIFKAYGRKAGGGILLYGPPGCGKTMIARATAGEINARFYVIELSTILDMWRGESEKKLSAFFNEARKNAPSVIFIDEVDALGVSRAKFIAGEMQSLVNQFLSELDGVGKDNVNVLVIGATNMPWQLDTALKRPGRFDTMIFVPPPDDVAREDLFSLLTKQVPKKTLDFRKLAKLTRGFSGADIKYVVEQAVDAVISDAMESNSVIPVAMRHFEGAIKKTRSSVKEWFVTAKNYVEFSNQSGVYDDLKSYIDKEF